MATFVTVAILALHGAAAFWFDPHTGKCEGEFQHCPEHPSEKQDCWNGSYLQCYSAQLDKEVILPCSEDKETKEVLKGLPCSNDTSTESTTLISTEATTIEDGNSGEFAGLDATEYPEVDIEQQKFDLGDFMDRARPALIVISSITAVILVLVILICIVAKCNYARSIKNEYHAPC